MRQALYRLYRPKTFEELVGQEHITSVIKQEMRTGSPSHAYLFIGSRGTGKTSCAKLVAKAVNCQSLNDGSPCGVCEICKGVDNGSLLDVLEIDAASNNGVDNIRDLREVAVFTPSVAKYRVYIIDEVHMLSQNAFNALLKILEEPPPHVIFILATTEVHKVLPTIISRCQRFDFNRIEATIIANRLLDVSKSEGITITEGAAKLIARLSDGGLRDALSLLDVSASSGDVTEDLVAKTAGLVGSEQLLKLCEALIDKNPQSALEIAYNLLEKSVSPQRLMEQLITHYRNLMLAKTLKNPENIIGCIPSQTEEFVKQGAKLSLGEILQYIRVLQNSALVMSKSTMKQTELELAIVLLCQDKVEDVAPTAPKPASSEPAKAPASYSPPVATTPQAVSQPAVVATQPSYSPPVADYTSIPQGVSQPAEIVSEKKVAPKPPQNEGGIVPFSPWPEVLKRLSNKNMAIYAMCHKTQAYFNGKQVLIDISNPVVLEMLRKNETTKATIKEAIFYATGERYGLGPYKPPEEPTERKDPLEELVGALPKNENIIIED